MRSLLLPIGLLGCLPVCAQGAGGRWNVDVHSMTGTLAGHYQGVTDGNSFRVDLKDDLALVRDKSKPGFGFEYQGHRFGVELASDRQDYLGSSVVKLPFTLNGQTFNPGVNVTSVVKSSTIVFNWTIRALVWQHVWFGFDLGVRDLTLDMKA